MDTNPILKEIISLKAAKTEVQLATGTTPTSMIVGDKLVEAMVEAGIKPERKHNLSFEKTMFSWGEVLGMEIWSHIPNDS